MSEVNVFDDRTTADLIKLVRFMRLNGLWSPASMRDKYQPYEHPFIYVSNDSGEEIPAYACMQVTGSTEISGQNYLTVDKPADTTGDAGWYLFNGHKAIADGEEGIAQTGPIVRAYKNTGTITAGDKWGPTSGQWYVSASTTGPFVAAGADDIATDVLKLFTGSGGGGGATLYRFTLNASLASGTADADILEMDGTDTGLDEDVLDPLGIFSSLTSVGDAGLCLLQNGSYYVIQAVCP